MPSFFLRLGLRQPPGMTAKGFVVILVAVAVSSVIGVSLFIAAVASGESIGTAMRELFPLVVASIVFVELQRRARNTTDG